MAVAPRSVTRALSMLDAIAAHSGPMSLAELSSALEVPKSTAHAILAALVDGRYIERTGDGFVIGLRAFEIGAAYARSVDLVSASTAELKALTAKLGATTHVAILDGDDVVYVAKQDPPTTAIRLASWVGARLPAAQTAVGKIQLAYSEVRDAADHGRVGDIDLSEIRSQGFATDEGLTAPGVRCIAAPVIAGTRCVAAIGVSTWMDPEADVEAIAKSVMDVAASVSRRLSTGSMDPQ